MTDEELLNYVEAKTIEEMLDGCEIDDHLGEKVYCTGAWAVTFRTDTICRLIDMARETKRTWVGLTDEEKSELWEISRAALPRYATFAGLIEAKLKERNT